MKTNYLIRTAIALSVVLLFAAQTGRSDDRTPTEIANAKGFVLDSVKLGMTEQEFSRLFPNAKPLSDLTNPKSDTKGFRVDSTTNTDGIDAAFWNGRLLEFYAWYAPRRTNEMGGYMTLIKRMIEKLGKGDADSKGVKGTDDNESLQIKWKINECSFFCEILVKPDMTRINITDTEAHTKRAEAIAKKAPVGF